MLHCYATTNVPVDKADRYRLLHKDLILVPGDEGGVKVMPKTCLIIAKLADGVSALKDVCLFFQSLFLPVLNSVVVNLRC